MRSTFRGAGWVKEGCIETPGRSPARRRSRRSHTAMLHRDWQSGTTTPVVWDDL